MDELFGMVSPTKVLDEERNTPVASIHEKGVHVSETSSDKAPATHIERK